VYAKGVPGPLALPVEYSSNKTFSEYVDDLTYLEKVTSGMDTSLSSSYELITDYLRREAEATLRNRGKPAEVDHVSMSAARSEIEASLRQHKVTVSKLDYLSSLLKDIDHYGSSIVAERMNDVTMELLRGHQFLSMDRRQELLMQVNILNDLVKVLLE
jgi:hypothetical protein